MIEDYKENYISGYISLYRSLFNSPLWTCEKFTRGQAWVDLLLLANYKDGYFYKREVKVNYKRGHVTKGILALSERWKWSRNKTQKFINDLEKEQQVKQHKSHVITIIEVVNYNQYQRKRTTSTTTSDTTAGQQQDTYNKVNKDNNVEEVLTPYENFIAEVKKGNHDYSIQGWLMKLKIPRKALTELLTVDFKAQLLTDNKKHKNTLELRKHFYNFLNTYERLGKLKKYKNRTKGDL